MTIKTNEPKRRVDLDQEIVKETHIVTVMTQSQKWSEVEVVDGGRGARELAPGIVRQKQDSALRDSFTVSGLSGA